MSKKRSKEKKINLMTNQSLSDNNLEASVYENYIPKYKKAKATSEKEDNERENDKILLAEATKILTQMSVRNIKQNYKDTDSFHDSDYDNNSIINENGSFSIKNDFNEDDENLIKLHNKVDEVIRECCIKVSIIAISANAAIMVPGIGKIIAGKKYFPKFLIFLF